MSNIIFNGVKYYKNNTTGYYSNSKRGMLHRDIYILNYGDIPEKYHVHHIDGNKENNNIANLELKHYKQHHSDHMTKKRREIARDIMLKKAMPLAKEWHSSESGMEWHKKHYENSLKASNETEIEKKCLVCKKEYMVNLSCRFKSKFCSNACKSKHRRDERTDDIVVACPVCEISFKTSKYKPNKTCSRKCGGILRSEQNGKSKIN